MPGIFTVQGMGLRFPAGSIRITTGGDGPEMSVATPEVRHDLWFTWLEIGCMHATKASDTGSRLMPALSDEDKATLLSDELRDGLVALTAFAFAFDGFYDVVRAELGEHPDASVWRAEGRRPTPRHKQIAETFRYHFKLGPAFTPQLKIVLQQLLTFRGRAVHPSSKYVVANFRPEIDSGVQPHFITFSGPHTVQCRALALELLSRLVERGVELAKPGADTGWLTLGREQVDRLSALYRVPGDDSLAFPPAADGAPTPSDHGTDDSD